jgi:hypothetical protein
MQEFGSSGDKDLIRNPLSKNRFPSPRLRHPSPVGEGTGVRVGFMVLKTGFGMRSRISTEV